MPCRTDDIYNPRDSRHYPNNAQNSDISQSQYNKLKKEADTVTRLLCSVLRALDKNDYPMTLTMDLSNITDLKEWWEEHQKVDRKRIEKEVAEAEKSLSGLSEEAKALLIQKLQG